MPLIFLLKKINNKPQNNSNIYLTSNVAKSEQNLKKNKKNIYVYIVYIYKITKNAWTIYTWYSSIKEG